MSCADVQTIQAGNGTSTQFSFDFPYIFKSEIHVYFWNTTTKEWDEKLTTDSTYPWRVTDANPTIVEFTGTAPPAPTTPTDPNEPTVDNVRIRRITNTDDILALFNPGSAIRSDDLNRNFEQLRYAIQEANCPGIPDDVDEYLKNYYWNKFDNAIYSGETWVSNDSTLSTTERLDERFSELKTGGYWDDRYYTEIELNAGKLDNRYVRHQLVGGVSVRGTGYGWSSSNLYVPTSLEVDQRIGSLKTTGYFDDRYYTEAEADARYWNVDSAEYIDSGDTWTPDDQHIATTAAIEARIVTLVDDVGGFVPLASYTDFPITNPDPSDGAGTVISIQNTAGLTHSGGTSTNATTTGAGVVTITGIPTTLASPVPDDFGMLVVTTNTLNTYTFHRLVAPASDVVDVAGNATNINTVAGQISPTNNVATVAGIAGNITTTAGISSSVTAVAGNATNINTVAGISGNVTTVAGISAKVTTVANNDANVTAVANNASNINTVSGSIANVNTVGGSIANVNTVATNVADVITVAADITDVTAVSTNIGAVSAIGADLANSFSNIDDYGSITGSVTSPPGGTSDIQTVATNIANVNTVAGNDANITTVAGISANVTTVAGNTTNINAVAADATDIGIVAAGITNVNAVGTNIASVNTAATNISAIIAAPTEATNAATSASAAATSATNAATSATNSASSASAAATSATNAATSASNASTSASNASSSATAAAGSASNAATSATAAATSETNAASSAALALQYRDDTAGILTQSGSDAYNVSTNQSWGDIISSVVSYFNNEVLADTLLTMSKGTNTYNYGTL